MATSPDVVILGGGVIGLTTAYSLARAGIRVTLLDQGDFGQESSWAGAGILPPADPRCARTPIEQLRAYSVTEFPRLAAELKELTGIDTGYLRCGGLEFLGVHAEAGADEWRSAGVEAQKLTAADARALEPALAENLGEALFLPDMAQVRNPWHLRALCAACTRLEVTLRPRETAVELLINRNRVEGVAVRGTKLAAGAVIIAAGAWTDQILQGLNLSLGIRPVRGQIMLVHPAVRLLQRIVLWGSQYLVPRGDGRILVGSTEEDVGFDKRTTVAGIHGLMHLAFKLVPALMDAPLEKAWAGLRPGSKDGLPFIGRIPGWDNAYVAAGHFRAGIQLSPGTALMLKEMILGQPATISREAFRLDRC
jgi:glycine oxidase